LRVFLKLMAMLPTHLQQISLIHCLVLCITFVLFDGLNLKKPLLSNLKFVDRHFSILIKEPLSYCFSHTHGTQSPSLWWKETKSRPKPIFYISCILPFLVKVVYILIYSELTYKNILSQLMRDGIGTIKTYYWKAYPSTFVPPISRLPHPLSAL
jgi:hypothetical protein